MAGKLGGWRRGTPGRFPGRLLPLLCALCLLLSACAPTVTRETTAGGPLFEAAEAALLARNGYCLSAAVLYNPEGAGNAKSVHYALEQSLQLNLSAELVDITSSFDCGDYDILYLDESIHDTLTEDLKARVMSFAEAGGTAVCANALHDAFPPEFFGVSDFVEFDGYPWQLSYPEVEGDLFPLREIIEDFHELLWGFADFEELTERSYGWGAHPTTAVSLAERHGASLYTVSDYGAGHVFFLSPLLPNFFMISGFDMLPEGREQLPFAPAAASANQIFLSRICAYVSKCIYGFSAQRVFGVYGSPSVAWELHYEEIGAMENAALITFSELCEAAGQIPSYTVVRNPYHWFAQSETMSYLLNGSGETDTLSFSMDLYENAYSSGTHVAAGDGWVELGRSADAASYFVEQPGENLRLFPCAADLNGDGITDFLCGSADGAVYYYASRGFTGLDGRLALDEPVKLQISAPSFSAPALLDVDLDGADDLILGAGDGSLTWYRCTGFLDYEPMGALMETGLPGQVLPAVRDTDGDGVPELLLGSDCGELTLYPGTLAGGRWAPGAAVSLGILTEADFPYGWVSPSWGDVNGDGEADIICGSFDGYVYLFTASPEGYVPAGAVTVPQLNYKGNPKAKFGTYATPLLLDLDGDGDLDLLCGYEEYGLNCPIDSPYFSAPAALQEQLDYCASHGYYVSAHTMTTAYSDEARERYELAAHKEALLSYGLDVTGLGTNQHTWFVSALDPTQTLRLEYEAGYRWNSGFSPAHAARRSPESQWENALALPYFLMVDGERSIFVQNVSVLTHLGPEATAYSGKYAMPVCAYHHCDMIYRYGPDGYLSAIETVGDFQARFDYNFLREDQLIYASAAEYDLTVAVTARGGSLRITPAVIGEDPFYPESYRGSCSLRFEPASRFSGEPLGTDADVWKREGDVLLLGLDSAVTLRSEVSGQSPLRRVNLPAEITLAQGEATVAFLEGGLMQVSVEGRAAAREAGWTADYSDGRTTFSRFGVAETLHITFSEVKG